MAKIYGAKEQRKSNIIKTLLLAGIVLSVMLYVFGGAAMFTGGHTLYTNKTSAANGTAEMCRKCHPVTVLEVINSSHRNAGCICHGYSPNSTDPTRDINIAHNMTIQIYCTNCHSDYDAAGNITIYSGVSGLNQSAHYITNNTVKLYNHSRMFYYNYYS